MCKKYDSLEIAENKIYSGQTYYSLPDADMSDIAVGFYRILYKKALDGVSILDGNDLANCCFAGDTMNSFNTISNMLRKKESLSNEEEKLLIKYEKQYHCLANFWILPSCIGRRSRKGNNLDSIDIFLNVLKEDYDSIMKKHLSYYRVWNNVFDFRKDHFLAGYNPIDTKRVRDLYAQRNGTKIINDAITRIEQRAKDISESKEAEELWNYFYENVKQL